MGQVDGPAIVVVELCDRAKRLRLHIEHQSA
jgi:hypothetical protein